MDDVVKLLDSTFTVDEYGNQIEQVIENTVFCKVRSVGRTEYYQAAQNNLFPEIIITISHYMDYNGERDLLWTDWAGAEKRYTVTRTYRDGNAIELTCEQKVSDYE